MKNVLKGWILFVDYPVGYSVYCTFYNISKGSEPCEPEINDAVARQPVDFKQ